MLFDSLPFGITKKNPIVLLWSIKTAPWVLGVYSDTATNGLNRKSFISLSFLSLMFFLLFFSIFNLFFIFGCAGSSLLSAQTFSIARLLIAVTFLVAEHGLKGLWTSVVGAQGLSGCSSWALEHTLHGCAPLVLLQLGLWNLPRLGIKPMPLHWQADS